MAKATIKNSGSGRKRTREIVGFTRAKQVANASSWFRSANSFRLAAQVIDECRDRIPQDSRPFLLNASLSLELIFKAILVKRKIAIPDGRRGHDLVHLCSQARVPATAHQLKTLELMSELIIWAARYPTPKKDEEWDTYHDVKFERHVIRSGHSVLRNRQTFPDWENYVKLWALCEAEYASI